MTPVLFLIAIAVLAVALLLTVTLLMRGNARADNAMAFAAITERLKEMHETHMRSGERLERELRLELSETARASRIEAGTGFAQFQQTLAAQLSGIAAVQNNQIEGFAQQLVKLTESNAQQLDAVRQNLQLQAQHAREEQGAALKRFGDTLNLQLAQLSESNDRRFGEVRATLEQKLKDIEATNALKLDEMRRTVDEKIACNAGTAFGRIVQARFRPARTSSSRTWRNANAGGWRRRSEKSADQCEDTRHLGRSAT